MDTERPNNQISILERKMTHLSNLLLEWKSYETILNMSYRELKEVSQLSKDDAKTTATSQHNHKPEVLRTKSDSMPHDISVHRPKVSDATYDPNIETEAEEQVQTDLTSIFNTEQAEKFEIEFEELRTRTASLFGENHQRPDERPNNIEVSNSFIDAILPDINVNPRRFDSLQQVEDVLDNVRLDDGTGENKIITEILQEKLDILENEKLTTKQKNRLNQIRRIIKRISEIRIYNPKLLEKLVQNMN